MSNFDDFLGNETIFGSDILETNLGEEDTNIGINSKDGTFNDPFGNELEFLSIVEKEVQSEQAGNNNSSNNDFSPVDTGIDLLTGNNTDNASESNKESEIANLELDDTSFAPPKDELQFAGEFGDFEGGDDVTLEIKNTDENVVETYCLTGKGQASLYRDDEDGKAYIFFSGTDETTSVKIFAKSNIQFSSYIGDSLKIETTGSIDAGSVTLSNPDETGLVLKSGIQGEDETLEVLGYDAIHLGEGVAKGINNKGEVVVDGDGASLSYIYSDGEINYLGSDNSITPNDINDSGQVVGYFVNSDNNQHAFVSSGGAISDLGVLPEAETYITRDDSGDLVEVPYDHARSLGYAINNNGQIVGLSSSKYSRGYDQFRWRAFISDGGSMTEFHNDLNSLFGYEWDFAENPDAYWATDSRAYGINDLGQVVGSIFDGFNKAFVYDGGQNINLHALLHSSSEYKVNSSIARHINNEGQIIITSGGSTFAYNNGEINTVSGSVFDLNNNGITVGSSSAYGGTATLYDIENNTIINLNIDSNIDSEEAILLSSARGINDKGQIAATGYFTEDTERTNHAFLLNPQFAEPELDDYISIGNISTFGDTVLLQGNEITLAGSAMTTTGGEIKIDGAAKVNSNLTIDTSVIDDETVGGDITFSETLDGVDAGSQSIAIRAGKGNLLFEQAVGGENPFLDLKVEGANTVKASEDITINGNLDLEVIDDIATANITADGLTTINLGKVGEQIYDSTGNVITGNITTQGLDVSNNGNFLATEITTTDGDIEIISLNNLTLDKLTAVNGEITLISGTGEIAVNNSIQGDKGLVALAQLDIITNEIQSSQGAVILKSGGVVTVNGSVIADDDISLAGVNNVSVGAVTSNDSGVALISATGIVNLGGAISSMEDVTLASALSLIVNQEITAKLGSVALVSTEGSVSTSAAIDSGIEAVIAAKQNVATKKIRTHGGAILIDAEQGTATVGGKVRSDGGDIYISALSKAKTKKIISKGGDVYVTSEQGLVRTGYIRTDQGNSGGKVYLQAAKKIKVAGSVNIDGNDYSIYTGVNETDWVNIGYELNKSEAKKNEFVIGDLTKSGTKAEIYGEYAFLDGDKPKSPIPLFPIIEFIRGLIESLQGPPEIEPPHADDINPVTGNPYRNPQDRELVEQMTNPQRRKIRDWIVNAERKVLLEENEVFDNGKIDDDGCFTAELGLHYGDRYDQSIGEVDITHSVYATQITGALGDYFVVTPSEGLAALFDGLVNESGRIVIENLEVAGSVAEVKTGKQYFLRKALNPDHPSYLGWKITLEDQRNLKRFENQLKREYDVATICNLDYFMSFSNIDAGLAAIELYGDKYNINIYTIPIKVS
ncbi:HAF family repeat protein [Xenococcus sp. PCC 7305]|uniref:hypothetical protein n=1 Tax=Xenococcus sp. PCC 7305 TaxID=102125 RepID=UPI0002AC9F89|nr:hypothetical protein [Xenococcus sp. PCC 7305]ELS01404.1 HAF family repeat protein [Xenococcus sp. PCC 7305]